MRNDFNESEKAYEVNEIIQVKPDKLKFQDFKIIGTLFETYIIAKTDSELYLFDQHAAH